MLQRLRNTVGRIPTPRRNGRLIALLLAALGGSLDVYSHAQYEALVATQTGNFILLVTGLRHNDPHVALLRWLSVIFFSCGYLAGHVAHDRLGLTGRFHLWRLFTLLPFLIICFLVPLVPVPDWAQVMALAASVGLLMHALADSRIGENPFALFMTSGNWRKMLSAWYEALSAGGRTPGGRVSPQRVAKALDYSLVVFGFIAGVLLMAALHHLVGVYAIWCVGLLAGAILCVGVRAERWGS